MVYGIQNAVEVSNFSWNDKKTRQGKESSILSRSCLNPLSGDSGAAGYVWNLETLIKELFVHIYDFF
jgi:F-box/leucine-rich repeat protein 2/20